MIPTKSRLDTLTRDFADTPRHRLMPVVGDSMAPTVPPGAIVAVAPIDHFDGAGLYVYHDGLGPIVVRAEWSLGEQCVCLSFDNHRYSSFNRSLEEFTQHVLGKVFAKIDVIEPDLIARVDRPAR